MKVSSPTATVRTAPDVPPLTSTTFSRLRVSVTIRRPSVLTMSGSSTPSSWLFVPENGVDEPPSAVPSRPGGAAAALFAPSLAAAVAPVAANVTSSPNRFP